MTVCEPGEALAAGAACDRDWLYAGIGLFVSVSACCCIVGCCWRNLVVRCRQLVSCWWRRRREASRGRAPAGRAGEGPEPEDLEGKGPAQPQVFSPELFDVEQSPEPPRTGLHAPLSRTNSEIASSAGTPCNLPERLFTCDEGSTSTEQFPAGRARPPGEKPPRGWAGRKRETLSEASTEDGGPPASHVGEPSECGSAVHSDRPGPSSASVAMRPQVSPLRSPGGLIQMHLHGELPSGHTDAPRTLTVSTPNGQQECSGDYVLVPGERPNGRPLWKQRGASRWLYSGPTARWCIAGRDVKEEGFRRSAGWISQSGAHRGQMPHKVSSVWRRWEQSRFVQDGDIKVSVRETVTRL